MKRSLTEYTDRELLRLFAERYERYDSLRDDELDFLSEHPNREIWDGEQEEEYQQLVGEVLESWNEVEKIKNFINGLK